jgi:hypothetical protein
MFKEQSSTRINLMIAPTPTPPSSMRFWRLLPAHCRIRPLTPSPAATTTTPTPDAMLILHGIKDKC